MNNEEIHDEIHEEIHYEIDNKDQLIAFDKEWVSFARANRAAYLAEPTILHCSIWDFIADRETRLIYELLFEKVRGLTKAVGFQYRCDTPTQRRFMQMTLSLLPKKHIHLSSKVMRIEERSYIALLDPTIARALESLAICSWCKRVELPSHGWFEIETAVNKLALFNTPLLPRLAHGICPDCLIAFRGWRKAQVLH